MFRTAPSFTASANLYPVIVGDWVTIGHNATVHGCVVEDAVLIGMGVVVLNGLPHRRKAQLLPAGAVVPEGTIVPPRNTLGWSPGQAPPANSAALTAPRSSNMPQNYLDYTEIYLNEMSGEAGVTEDEH